MTIITFSRFKFYAVGGSVRDELLGKPCKDLDLVCIGPESFNELEREIVGLGGVIFISKPEFYTVRCKLPGIGPVDVCLGRTDGNYSDGRRPDSVGIAQSLEEETSRRDFRCNALAKDLETGELLDYHGGVVDIQNKVIQCVGRPQDRFCEDALRLVRSIRFSIILNFVLDNSIEECLNDHEMVKKLKNVSVERIREELRKMFQFNSLKSIELFNKFPLLRREIFESGRVWLKPTMEER